MFVSMKDYEVARERGREFARQAREENRARTLTGGFRFGRQVDRVGRMVGAGVRSFFERLAPVERGGNRRYA